MTTDLNQNQVPDYIELIASSLDSAYNIYMRDGLAKPPVASRDNGRYPVYISSSYAETAYGYTSEDTYFGDNPNSVGITEKTSYSSYLVLRSNYKGYGIDPVVSLQATAAHEFQHGIQYGYSNGNIDGYVAEMAASWAEAYVFQGNADHLQYDDIFLMPDIPIDYNTDENLGGSYDMRQYSAWVFLQYLTDRFGAAIMKDVYKLCVTHPDCEALSLEITSLGYNYTQIIDDFFVALTLVSSKSACAPYTFLYSSEYRSKKLYPAYEAELTYQGLPTTYSSQFDGNGDLYRMSADYIRLTPNQNFNINVNPTTNDNFSVYLLVADDTLNPSVFTKYSPVKSGDLYSFSVKYEANKDYSLVIVNNAYSTFNESYLRDDNSNQYAIDLTNYKDLGVLDAIADKAFIQDGKLNLTCNKGGEAEISIYDLLGAKVKGVFNGELSEGSNLIDIGAAQMPAGVYFLSIQTKFSKQIIKISVN